MKMKGFSGLKQAMEDTGLYDEPVYTGLRRADKVRELTHVGKARRTPEPPLYAEVKVRAITKRKATKKPDNGPGGKWFAHAEPTLDWYLRRLQG